MGKLLTTTQSVFMSALSDLSEDEDEIPPQYIPCPLDVRRTAVHSTQYHPFMLSELQSGTQLGLLGLVLAVCEIQDHTSRVLPILIDEKIHCSIMKMKYGVSYHEYNVGHKFCQPPPPGVRYMAPIQVHRYCHIPPSPPPLMVAFSHHIQAADVPVYAFPKPIFMECMFASLFVCASKYKANIQQKLVLQGGRCHPPMVASSNAGRLLGHTHTVYTLLFEYTALFLIGHPVRECSYSTCSGEVAHKVLQY